jgi:hypothetical protein
MKMKLMLISVKNECTGDRGKLLRSRKNTVNYSPHELFGQICQSNCAMYDSPQTIYFCPRKETGMGRIEFTVAVLPPLNDERSNVCVSFKRQRSV